MLSEVHCSGVCQGGQLRAEHIVALRLGVFGVGGVGYDADTGQSLNEQCHPGGTIAWKHYNDVTWASWCLKIVVTELFVEQTVQFKDKVTHVTGPL